VLGLLYPRRLQKAYHAAGGGCRNRAYQVRSRSFEEAGVQLVWTWRQVGDWLGRLYIRVHLRWVSRWVRRLLVVTRARCPLTKPVVAAVELQATTEPRLQPGRAARRYLRVGPCSASCFRGPGGGVAPRPQALPVPAAALVLYISTLCVLHRLHKSGR
jgi:hypothetical protein